MRIGTGFGCQLIHGVEGAERKDRCVVLAHPDNTVELVIDTEFASAYDNGHNIQRYPLTELPTPHGRLIIKTEEGEEIEIN